MQNPLQYKIPKWFLNRQKDIVDGKDSQILSNGIDSKLREDLERLKKIRNHRGLRHFWGLRVRGQHTKTTGKCSLFILPIECKTEFFQGAVVRLLVCRKRGVKRILYSHASIFVLWRIPTIHSQYAFHRVMAADTKEDSLKDSYDYTCGISN